MLKRLVLRWLAIIGSGTCLLQATTGCPTGEDLKNVLVSNAQSAVDDVIGLYTEAAVNAAFGV